MIRLKKLIQKHGIETNIWNFNKYYGIDLLRCSIEDFQTVLDNISISDAIRFRLELGEIE